VHREQRCGSKPLDSRPPETALYSIKPPICFEQALGLIVGTHNTDPMVKSDEKYQKEGLMTRKLLLTAAIVALAFTPPIGTGTAQARGLGGGGFGGGFHGGGFRGGFGRGFYGGFGGFYPGYYGYAYFPYCYYCY
jgi:hypothetical protein